MPDISYIKLFHYDNNYYLKYIKNGKRLTKKLNNTTPKLILDENDFALYYNEIKPYVRSIKKAKVFASDDTGYIVKPKAPLSNYFKIKRIINKNSFDKKDYLSMPLDYLLLIELFPEHPTKIELNKMNIGVLDIEVYSKYEFPKPELAKYPVSVITIKDFNSDVIFVFYYPFNGQTFLPPSNLKDNLVIKKCKNEHDLLNKFFNFCIDKDWDIIIGWNVENFDLKYLINRYLRVCPPSEDNKKVYEKFNLYSRYDREGVLKLLDTKSRVRIPFTYIIDIMETFKKFINSRLESYTLNFVANKYIHEKKLDYSEEGNLTLLYENNLQKYIEYNIQDVLLVDKIEKKFKTLQVLVMLSYLTYSFFDEATQTIVPVEKLVTNMLLKHNIIPPPPKFNAKKVKYIGGYVKDIEPGLYDWVSVFDISSSYPNQIRTWNISNETLITPEQLNKIVKDKNDLELLRSLQNEVLYVYEGDPTELEFVEDKYLNRFDELQKTLTPVLQKYNLIGLPGALFTKKVEGVFPKIITELYTKRLEYKRKTIEYRKKALELESQLRKRGVEI